MHLPLTDLKFIGGRQTLETVTRVKLYIISLPTGSHPMTSRAHMLDARSTNTTRSG